MPGRFFARPLRSTPIAFAAFAFAILAAGIIVWRPGDSAAGVPSGDPAAQASNQHEDGQGDDALDWIGSAGSLEAITRQSEVIVLARYVRVRGAQDIYPTGAGPGTTHLGKSPAVTFSLLEFEIDEYIKGDGPRTLVVRQTGDVANGRVPATFPVPQTGEQILMFLTKEPFGDDTWASVNGPWGRMKVENGALRYQNGARDLVEYMQAPGLPEATGLVRAEIARQARPRP